MTRYAIAGSAHRADALALRPFTTSGTLSGVRDPWTAGRLRGHAERAFYADRNRIDYAILSYLTPIAWHTPDGWTVVEDTFSITTSRHQNAIYYIPRDRTVGFNWSTFSDAQRRMIYGLRDGKHHNVGFGQQRRTLDILQQRGIVLQDGFNPGEYRLAPSIAERVA